MLPLDEIPVWRTFAPCIFSLCKWCYREVRGNCEGPPSLDELASVLYVHWQVHIAAMVILRENRRRYMWCVCGEQKSCSMWYLCLSKLAVLVGALYQCRERKTKIFGNPGLERLQYTVLAEFQPSWPHCQPSLIHKATYLECTAQGIKKCENLLGITLTGILETHWSREQDSSINPLSEQRISHHVFISVNWGCFGVKLSIGKRKWQQRLWNTAILQSACYYIFVPPNLAAGKRGKKSLGKNHFRQCVWPCVHLPQNTMCVLCRRGLVFTPALQYVAF